LKLQNALGAEGGLAGWGGVKTMAEGLCDAAKGRRLKV
jgi:hypothetical protein